MKKVFAFALAAILLVLAFGGVYKMASATDTDEVKIASKSAFMMEADSGTVLRSENEDKRLPIASVVKTMTLLLAFEEIEAGKLSLDEKVVVSETASGMGGSQVFIDAGAEYSISDLIRSVIIASANDASVAIAERIAGTETEFVNLMNQRAAELGLTNTNFANSTGLPAPGGYASAKDIAVIMQQLIKHDGFFKYSRIYLDELVHPSGRITGLANTNKLVRFYDGCDGGKTGSTHEAGFCLVATAKRGDMRLITVVLGNSTSKARNAEVSNLFNWGFKNFENKTLVQQDECIEIAVKGGEKKVLKACPETSYNAVTKKSDKADFKTVFKINEKIEAPIQKGSVVGKIFVQNKDGSTVKEINLLASETVKEQTILGGIKEIIENWAA